MNEKIVAKGIKKKDLSCGEKYICYARNFYSGIWDGEKFKYIRNKFGDVFIDYEYHWDDGGTVVPLKLASECYASAF